MEKNRIRSLLFASIMIMLSIALLVGGTFALWSSSKTVTNHLQAGKLDLELYRTELKKHVLNKDGYMNTLPVDTTEVNLTGNSTQNVFGIDNANGELVAPTSWYEAKLKIKNTGDVAFKYDIIIRLKTIVNGDGNVEVDQYNLAKQISVYATNKVDGDYTYQGQLSEFIDQNSKDAVIASYVAKGTTESFKVKIVFDNDADPYRPYDESIVNNNAMNDEVYFDLIVKAVQLTTNPESTTESKGL